MQRYSVQWSLQTTGRIPQQVVAEIERYIESLRTTVVVAKDECGALDQIADLEWRNYSDAVDYLRGKGIVFHGQDGDFSVVGTIVHVEPHTQQ
ncbi:MAG: hypothetical protein KatS3mg038_3391 [Candidatus Kapaibacterium sp.]|nr:MAG: hypothetical protein KatS3mg038_3391 [Candidatus Kapabacteria bacterium]